LHHPQRPKVHQHDDTSENALFDLACDPQELHNLLEEPQSTPLEYPKLQAALEDWSKAFGDLKINDIKPSREELERLKSQGYVQ
jgi:hypothetical protein